MSHLMLTKLRTVFQFQHSLCISWFSSFSWSAFSLAAYARSGSLCNFSAWSAKSSAEADTASASVCGALLFTFNSLTSSLRAFLFSPATTFDLWFFWSSLSGVFVPSTCAVQQQLFVTNIDVVNTANSVNVEYLLKNFVITCLQTTEI